MFSVNGFRVAGEGMKLLKPKFGFGCYAVDGIVCSIASVNDVFGMTKTYSRGLEMMLLGR